MFPNASPTTSHSAGLSRVWAWLARPAEAPGRPFRLLALVTVLAIFALIVVGGIVRVTNSGLGCPDWPLCHGQIIPPARFDTLVEYSHRLTATLVSILVITTGAIALLRYRRHPWIVLPAAIGVALLVGQAVLGGIVVLTELDAPLVVGHLAVAEAFFAAFIVLAVAAYGYGPAGSPAGDRVRYRWLAVGTALAIFVVMLTGSYMTARGAEQVCPDWPLCSGSVFPDNEFTAIHMLHRYMVALSAVLVVFLVVATWRARSDIPASRTLSALLGVALVAQALVGAANIWGNFRAGLEALHLASATLVWGIAVLLAALTLRPRRLAPVEVESEERASSPSFRQTASDYIKLTKPRIILLLLVTALGGMILAGRGLPDAGMVVLTLAGVGFAAGGANSINQYLDRDIDFAMSRTRRRPVPSSRLSPDQAFMWGVALNVVAFVLLASFVNLLSAVLTLSGTLFYVFVYTMWLKRTSAQNIVIGGAAGAVPALVGWAAVTGSVGLPAWYLFAIVFFWTPPHFWALALLLQRDYAAAGVPMLPVVYGPEETKRHILLYTFVLFGVTLLFVATGAVGWLYLGAALVLNAVMVWFAFRLQKEPTVPAARRLYLYSLLYLALLFAALMVDSAAM